MKYPQLMFKYKINDTNLIFEKKQEQQSIFHDKLRFQIENQHLSISD